jgi:hypothetical protein
LSSFSILPSEKLKKNFSEEPTDSVLETNQNYQVVSQNQFLSELQDSKFSSEFLSFGQDLPSDLPSDLPQTKVNSSIKTSFKTPPNPLIFLL